MTSGIGVMKRDPIYGQEFAIWRIVLLGKASGLPNEKGCAYGRARNKKRGRQT
jgi:hypothetical protein